MITTDAIIETPRGSAVKFDFDTSTRFFRIKKALPAGMVFPFDFGFIPDTKGEDGDPLDIIIISEFSGFAGCRVECRLIGVIEARQSKKKHSRKMIRNDRLIGIPLASVMFEKINTLNDLPEKMMKELDEFFVQYNKMEERHFGVIKKAGAKTAFSLIKAAKE